MKDEGQTEELYYFGSGHPEYDHSGREEQNAHNFGVQYAQRNSPFHRIHAERTNTRHAQAEDETKKWAQEIVNRRT
jgi:hypothetical protein